MKLNLEMETKMKKFRNTLTRRRGHQVGETFLQQCSLIFVKANKAAQSES